MSWEDDERNHYNEFYSSGGWSYSYDDEREFLASQLQQLAVAPSVDILEIGCGMGFHSALLHNLGHRVTAIDISKVGIDYANQHHSGPRYMVCDLKTFQPEDLAYDIIFARGMAWYHFELTQPTVKGVNVIDETKRLFRALRPDGFFILQISTDFSGTYRDDGVLNNTFDAYRALFECCGKIERVCNWHGAKIGCQTEAMQKQGHIFVVTKK